MLWILIETKDESRRDSSFVFYSFRHVWSRSKPNIELRGEAP